MTQNWHKLGIIHRPDTSKEWAAGGMCHLPTPLVMGDLIRVYYTSLDANNRGSIGFVDLDATDLTKVRYTSPEPVMRPGPLGAFDCDGVVPSHVHWRGGGLDMWYVGFQRCQSTPYMLYVGHAMSMDNGLTWETAHVPHFERSVFPLSCGAPFYDNGDIWLWNTTRWEDDHYVNEIVRRGDDIDAVLWPLRPNGEYALGRPWIVREEDLIRMWYSIRSHNAPTYRMGYAEIVEDPIGLHWTRKDDEVSSLMPDDGGNAEYAAIVDVSGKRWALYNGAQQGRDGIHLAILEQD